MMANEHAVPEEHGEKVHGDKLDGVLDKTEGKGAGSVEGQGSGGHRTPHTVMQVDDEDGNGVDKNPNDGKTMP